MSGGEPDARRLLALARQEILQEILPQVSGEARYRLRLVVNALKIAGQELEAAGPGTSHGEDSPGAEPGALCAALRRGDLDGDATVYRLLLDITHSRNDQLG
jgi:hypothetical protein